jgi:large subunit ribosomal protein L9
MKIVLRTDVNGLGKRGDVAEVADGYARNFLLPKGKALVATPGAEAQAETMRRARAMRAAADRADAATVASSLGSATVTITAKAGRGGKLFGSVSAADISDAIERQLGAVVDRRTITIAEPIKQTGIYRVTAHLHSDVVAAFQVSVVAPS